MTNRRIQIQVRGAHEDKDLVRFSDLLAELGAIQNVLRRLDRMISKSQNPTTYFRVTELRYSSPAFIEIEGVPIRRDQDITEPLVERFVGGLSGIKENHAPIEFDYDMLDAYRGIGLSLRKNSSEILIAGNGSSVQMTEDLSANIKSILGEDEVFQGAISGILEFINIHEGANRFNLYPVAGPTKVECHFQDDMFDKAISLVNRYVEVSGRVKYHKREKFPCAVDVYDLIPFPKEEDLPSFLDLRGLAPGATGGVSTDDFVSAIRNDL